MKHECKSSHINKLLPYLFLVFFFVTAQKGFAQEKSFTLNLKNVTLKTLFDEIEQKSAYRFTYRDEVLPTQSDVNVNTKVESVDKLLNQVLTQKGLTFSRNGNTISINPKKADQTTKRVSGIVTDQSGEPIIGANIVVEGSKIGTVTDVDGNYSLEVPGNASLKFSYIGYSQQILPVNGKSLLNVKLADNARALDEIVVVGYGTQKKSDLTGAVSTMREKDFNVGLVTSPSQLIQGRVPGVNITSNNGEPGGGVTIRVRGSNSIRSGQDPLYVIDGVPLDIPDIQPGGASITGVGASANKNPLNFLNPDDIESIDILKDASATAIYGSRGANGVIMISTKKGKEGQTKVSFSSSVSSSSLPKEYPVLAANQYRDFMNANSLKFDDKGANTNWQDEIFRTGISQSHSVSFGGGNKNGNYMASVSYLDQEGIIKSSGMDKVTGRFNVRQSIWDGRLTLEANMFATRTNDKRLPIGESGGVEGDLLLSALKANPTLPVFNADGTYLQVSKDVRNPVAMIDLTSDKTRSDRLLTNVSGKLDIINGLSYKLNVALDNGNISRKVAQKKELIYLTNKGTVDINDAENTSYLIENYFTYNFKLNNKHKFDLLAGHSYQKFRNYSHGMSMDGFEVDVIDYINDLAYGSSTKAKVYSDIVLNELQSFFGRVNYNLMDKYMLTVNFRADGSTKFGKNNKYGLFPSAALAWRINEEEFMKNIDVISNLKLRTSYGITGNQEIPNKISQLSLGSTGGAIINGGNEYIPGITLTRTPNPDIKWEKTTQYDLGLDFGLFNGRLSGSVDLYSKETSNVLLEVFSISPAPTAKVWKNVENMKIMNKGVEVSLSGVMIETKDFNWSATVNFSKVKNEVKNLPMSFITTGSPSGPGITGFSSQIIKSGYPIGTFWGYKFLGFDDKGLSKYEMDETGKPKEQYIGNALPDFTLNLSTSLSWKNLDFSVFFNGVFGNDVYNNLANVMDQRTLVSSGWNTTENQVNSTEAFNNKLDYSSRFIENGSYIRLSSANLGYTVPLKANKWISKLRVSLSGNNLFVLTDYTGYDPEVNASRVSGGVPSFGIGWTNYPMSRTFSFGVNAEF